MPSEFHCPLLEDDCITVKHVIQEERNNAIEFVERNRLPVIYNNVSHVEYNEYGWYCAMQYEYNPTTVVETKYYYDFDITIQGTSYEGMHTETINVSGNLLRIRKGYWTGSTLEDWGYYLRFGVLGEDREPSKVTPCGFAPVTIAPEYYGGGFGKYYFRESETTITWNTPPTEPRKEIKIVSLDGSVLRDQSAPIRAEFSWNWLQDSPEQATTYKINKADHLPLAILKQLEVTDFAYNFVSGYLNPLDPELEIPRHCTNLYMSTYPPNVAGVVTTDNKGFIMQICTDDPGTFKRPVLEISCGCGESCPDGTCPVECTDHVCCYSSEGFPVKDIPLSNYDG